MKAQFLIVASALALAACGGNGDSATGNIVTTDPTIGGTNDTMLSNDMTAEDANAMADNGMVVNDTAATAPMTAQAFANTAAASDAYEIASSKLAGAKATDAGVKKFAAQMIKDHTASTAKLKAAAGTIKPDPTLNAEQKANIAALEAASGADFDSTYKTQQLAAHGKTLVALKGYEASGDDAALKTFASSTAPVVQGHLTMLQGM
jgi:putative membrane protein